MILMKTKGTKFKEIWEKNGLAPFNSSFAGNEIFSFSKKCPLLSLGFYSGEQGDKNVSLLRITNIDNNLNLSNDIQIKFEFIKKIDINSNEFDYEISKIFSNKILIIIPENSLTKILSKFGYKLNLKETNREKIIPPTNYTQNYLNNSLLSFKDWQDFEKKTSKLFNMLDFEVKFEGHKQQKKRRPDFYCYTPPRLENVKYCIVVDCKYQEDYFINAADERAMTEYINGKKTIIAQEGIQVDKLYFLFLALSFSPDTKIKLHEISQETKCFGALLSLNNLQFIVEKKLRMGYKFYLELFPKLFKNLEMSQSMINYQYKIEDEYRV